MKKYMLWLLWVVLKRPSCTVTVGAALFLPWLSRLFIVQGHGPQEEEMLVVEQPNVFTVRVIPYSLKKLLTTRKEDSK